MNTRSSIEPEVYGDGEFVTCGTSLIRGATTELESTFVPTLLFDVFSPPPPPQATKNAMQVVDADALKKVIHFICQILSFKICPYLGLDVYSISKFNFIVAFALDDLDRPRAAKEI